MRQSLRESLQTQYIRTARAKGLSETRVLYRHALPNALLPSLTVLGVQFGQLLGGVVVVERIFNWPGIGGLLDLLGRAAGLQHARRVRDGDRRRVRRRLDADRDLVPVRRPADPEGLMRRWLRRNPRLQIGLLLLAPFLLAAVVPGVIAPHSPDRPARCPVRAAVSEPPARYRRGRPRHPLAARLRSPHRPQDQPRRHADRGA